MITKLQDGQVAILDFTTREVVIIDVPSNIQDSWDIEEYLESHGWDTSNIQYMS